MLVHLFWAFSLFAAAIDAHDIKRVPSNTTGKPCIPSTFSHLLPPGGSVLFTQSVPANGTFTDPTGNGDTGETPLTEPGLPPLCAVKFTVPSSNNSQVDFALFLPDAWNERYMAVGNGGFSGSIVWFDMAPLSHYGFAVMSTNTGHYSGGLDASWALNDQESKADWGHRAMHLSVVLSKQIVKDYYDQTVRYSYYSSCSNGGRQALKELTEYPEDFDGIIAGAPAWSVGRLFTWMYELQLPSSLVSPEDQLSIGLLQTFQKETIRQCDIQDGVKDGIIGDPYGCHFIPEKLLCNGTAPKNTTTCFSPAQLHLLYHVLNDWVDVNQTFVFPALALGTDFSALATEAGAIYGSQYLQNFVYNTSTFAASDFGYYQTVQLVDDMNPGNQNVNYEVDEFRAHGGKLIHYHGLSDQLIPPGLSLYWHSQIQQALQSRGLSMDDWYRLYTVPGMEHCASTNQDAPWYFGAASHAYLAQAKTSTPGYEDAKHDIVLAMMDWVEKDIAPEELIATRFYDDLAANGVQKQRPICPYPQQAVYLGQGNADHASSWRCT